jgi:hypothetical protein
MRAHDQKVSYWETYEPGSHEGRSALAHEVTDVVRRPSG